MEDREDPRQALIELWMSTTDGRHIHYTHVCDSQFDKPDWPALGMIFNRMRKKGLVEPVTGKHGWFRCIDDSAKPLDWQNYEPHMDSGLLLPFNLRDYVFLYPDSTVIVAGSKSSGKTGILYRVVAMNMHQRKVVLLTNLEGGLGMLRDRFDAMDIEIPHPAPFEVINVFDNFHDYIKEAGVVYVIDYIDAPDGTDFYLIAAQIKKIDQKLKGLNSMAVIGLQKPQNRDTAFGGEQTLKVAALYIAMDDKKLKIVDAKVPADKKLHPKNMAWTFQYSDEGTKFLNIVPYYGE